jgi:putative membrane protein
LSTPALFVVLCAVLGLYSMAMSRVAAQLPARRQWLHLLSFSLGLLAATVTLILSPSLLGTDFRFTANMGQFVLAVDVAPALLLIGTPALMVQALRRLDAIGRRLTMPLVAGIIATIVIMAWHVPAIFQAASRDQVLWVAKELTLLAIGLLFWWPVAGPYTPWRPSYPVQIIYLAAMRLPMAILGAILAFADRLIYGTSSLGFEICAPASLADQQAAGMVMWSGGGLILFAAFTVVFFRWAAREEARQA